MKNLNRWLRWALIPLGMNLVLWQWLYIPGKAALQEWNQNFMLVETKPKMEALLNESREIRLSWEPTRFSQKNPSAAVEAVRQLAGRYDLQIQKLQAQEISRGRKEKTAAKIPGLSAMPITVVLAGNFNQMVHWISDLEHQYGFQIDSWQMTGAGELGQPTKIAVELTAFMGDA